jgi:hypothetical protein
MIGVPHPLQPATVAAAAAGVADVTFIKCGVCEALVKQAVRKVKAMRSKLKQGQRVRRSSSSSSSSRNTAGQQHSSQPKTQQQYRRVFAPVQQHTGYSQQSQLGYSRCCPSTSTVKPF